MDGGDAVTIAKIITNALLRLSLPLNQLCDRYNSAYVRSGNTSRIIILACRKCLLTVALIR